VVSHRFVTLVDIQFCSHAVVLLVEEVDLISQLLSDLLIGVLLVLHVKFLQVLSTLVEVTKSEDFVIASLNLAFLAFDSRFSLYLVSNNIIVLLSEFCAPLVRQTEFSSPLVVVSSSSTESSSDWRRLQAFFFSTSIKSALRSIITGGPHLSRESLAHLELLLYSLDHVVGIAFGCKAADDSILRRHVEFS